MADFPDTRWTMIARLRSADEAQRQRAFEELCEDYWHPLYTFARSLGSRPDDAADLTQDFVLKLLQKDGHDFDNVLPERGRLRTWLRTIFRNHLTNHHRDQQTLKRGSAVTFQPLDLESLEREFAAQDASRTPDEAFDRVWMRDLLRRALQRLISKHDVRGRGDFVRALEPYLTDSEGADQPALATRLGISENALRTALHRLRREYGEILRTEVAATLPEGDDVDEELRHLITVAG